MFESLGKKKKDSKNTRIVERTEIVKNQAIQQITTQLDQHYYKPTYNPQTRKAFYDDGVAHNIAKSNAFSSNDIVRDPYTGAELVPTVKEARMVFGDKWQEHLAEADHIDPLNQLVRRAENNPWLTTKDIKDTGNSQDNFQIISRKMNQTGGKGGSTQEEWSKDYEKMQRISNQTGESEADIAERICQVGNKATKLNNAKFAKASVKNVANTAHKSGEITATLVGGNAAAISAIFNIKSFINGEKTVDEALKDVGIDTCKATVSGYAQGAALTVLNHTLTSSKSEFLVALGKNNVASKIIATVAVTGETVVKWGNGEISTEECLIELGDKGCSFGGAYCGAMIGQAIIPIPIVGGAIGSLIGGTLTSQIYNGVVQEMQATSEEERRRQQEILNALIRYYAEQERRKQVQELIRTNTEKAVLYSIQSIVESEALQRLFKEVNLYSANHAESERRIAECVLVTLQLQEYRRQLSEYANGYFREYRQCFLSAFELMDTSLSIGDYHSAMASSNQIVRLFGKIPVVENTEDFKKKIFGNSDITF